MEKSSRTDRKEKDLKIVSVTISDSKASIIGDALASVVEHVDLVILVDTGIADDTVDVARQIAGSKLRVCKHIWKNDFAAARNAGLAFARQYEADWAVMVDTDERFFWEGVSLREIVSNTRADVLLITSMDETYPKEKIFRLSAESVYIGPVHEVPIGGTQEIVQRVRFDELSKTDAQGVVKRKRDLEALTEWVKRPEYKEDGRWWYYLGDTHAGLGQVSEAAAAFSKCVELRKPVSEEGAWAAFKQIECLMALGKLPDVVEACTRGLGRYAGMPELMWQAALASYRLGRIDQAVCWAQMAVSVGKFEGCAPTRTLFVHLPSHYELPYDILRHSLPTEGERKKAEMSMHAAKRARLGITDDRSMEVRSVSRIPQRWEIRQMLRPVSLRRLCDSTHVVDLTPSYKQLEAAGLGKYHPMNPSVCVHKGELWAIVRMVNYTIENGSYISSDPDGKIRTVNLLGKLVMRDFGWSLDDFSSVGDLDESPRRPSMVLGYEDMRLFSAGGVLKASATVQDHLGAPCQIALLDLSKDGDVTKATVQTTDRPVEKNWMPIVHAVSGKKGGPKEIEWLYDVDPTKIRRADGSMTTASRCTLALDHLRGGSQVIPFEDGHLCVTHETISMDGWGVRRIYLHRFVRFDKDMKVTAVSPSWTFDDGHHGIEFCSGLAPDPSHKERVVLGFGIEDRQAKLLVVPAEEIKKMQWIEAP